MLRSRNQGRDSRQRRPNVIEGAASWNPRGPRNRRKRRRIDRWSACQAANAAHLLCAELPFHYDVPDTPRRTASCGPHLAGVASAGGRPKSEPQGRGRARSRGQSARKELTPRRTSRRWPIHGPGKRPVQEAAAREATSYSSLGREDASPTSVASPPPAGERRVVPPCTTRVLRHCGRLPRERAREPVAGQPL